MDAAFPCAPAAIAGEGETLPFLALSLRFCQRLVPLLAVVQSEKLAVEVRLATTRESLVGKKAAAVAAAAGTSQEQCSAIFCAGWAHTSIWASAHSLSMAWAAPPASRMMRAPFFTSPGSDRP